MALLSSRSAASVPDGIDPTPAAVLRLPRLRIVGGFAAKRLLPEPARGPVKRWRDHGGRVAAYAYRADGAHWMHLPGLATFRFADLTEVTAVPEGSVPADRVRDVYQRTVLPFVLQAFGLEVLHASAVVTDRGIAAFCARAKTGKSTLAYGLHRRGYRLWADDTVAFHAGPRAVHAVPLPFQIRLRPASREYFGPDGHRGQLDERGAAGRPMPLAAVLVLERTGPGPDVGVDLRRLPAGHGLRMVLAHAHSFGEDDPARNRLLVSQYLALVRDVPVFHLRFPSDLERLPQTLDQVEGAVG
jgi:hypothetical protein